MDLKVQQELLRHADIRTTMSIYTQAMPDAMRRANSRVVEMVLLERKVGREKRGSNRAAIRVPKDAKSFQLSPSASS